MTWRYRLTEPFEMAAPELAGVVFHNERLSIENGRIRIREHYAWDGCSPAKKYFGIWFGTPDGPLGIDNHPVTWYASLVHDALCQFRPQIEGLRQGATVDLFRRMLIESKAPWWITRFYPCAVYCFGPQKWLGNAPTKAHAAPLPPRQSAQINAHPVAEEAQQATR